MTNPLRRTMVNDAVRMCRNDDLPITIENVRKYLPGPHCELDPATARGKQYRELPDFELDDQDLAQFVEAEPEAPAEQPAPEPEATAEPPQAEQQPEPVDHGPEAIAAAERRVRIAERDLNNARVRVMTAQNIQRAKWSALAAAVSAFQQGLNKPMTQTELLRQHAQEQQAIREAIARGDMPAPTQPARRLKSAVDRVAFYSRGGGPATGGGKAYSRGAYPAQLKGAPNYDPRRGAVAKLPSGR